MEAFAAKGLRTLVFGMKTIEWSKGRDVSTLEPAEFENNLTLLGATGVEDLL